MEVSTFPHFFAVQIAKVHLGAAGTAHTNDLVTFQPWTVYPFQCLPNTLHFRVKGHPNTSRGPNTFLQGI